MLGNLQLHMVLASSSSEMRGYGTLEDHGGRYVRERSDAGKVRPHELLQHVDLTSIARDNGASVVRSRADLERLREMYPHLQRPDYSAQMRSVVQEVLSWGHLAAVVGRHIGEQVRQVTRGTFSNNQARQPDGIRHVSGQPNGLRVMPAPGFGSFNDHVLASSKEVNIPRDAHPAYDSIHPNRDVTATAEAFAAGILQDRIPTIIHAHSQGGQVALLTAALLEEFQHPELVAGLVLVSPASAGPTQWLQTAIRGGRHLIPRLVDMLEDSAAVRTWQTKLSPEMRDRTVVIQYAGVGGDGMTDAEHSLVEGSTMLATHQTFPHEQAGRDPRNPAAKLARTVMEAMNAAYHQYSLAS